LSKYTDSTKRTIAKTAERIARCLVVLAVLLSQFDLAASARSADEQPKIEISWESAPQPLKMVATLQVVSVKQHHDGPQTPPYRHLKATQLASIQKRFRKQKFGILV
jgi:hypothetical protein